MLCLGFAVQIQDSIWKFEENLVQKSHCGSVPSPPVEFHRKAREARLPPAGAAAVSLMQQSSRVHTTFSSCNLHGFQESFSN